MPATDPDQVPATPLYTITVTATGDTTLDGEPVHAEPHQEPRVAALAEIRVRAALCDRTVRVNAKEPDGTVWPLLVDTDGNVTVLETPHPTPPRPTPTPATAPDWQAPLPPHHQPLYTHLLTAETTHDLAAAITIATALETALTQQYGPHHPHTLNILTLRTWLTLRRQPNSRNTIELLLHTTQQRHEADAQPLQDTTRCARNAHALWHRLAHTDPPAARELSADVVRVLDLAGETSRARDIRGRTAALPERSTSGS
ncbi:hypothetical protein [Streptomyces olivoreticuli]|uniref:hypothetical protein n=1 Tax=Streptomyces olivoreticuli TaxID=68246 RepID=UPI000E26B3F5|nr:hypothetical protein [Streptomyces olivoreticuli]